MEQRKKAEELARIRGVSLAPSASQRPAPPPAPVPDTWYARNMPGVAQALADMKAQLPPDLWRDAVANLKRGQGYAIEAGTGLAIGNPPRDVYRRGKAAERDGFQVLRVSLVDLDAVNDTEARAFLGMLESGPVPGLQDVPAALEAIARRLPHLVKEFADLPWPVQVLHPTPLPS